MKQAVIIVAGGKGTRFGANVPKQFLLLNGLPIYIQTIKQFVQYDEAMQIVLVLPMHTPDAELAENIAEVFTHLGVKITACRGGATRFYSVKNGLQALADDVAVVGVHDAVRPLVSQDVIAGCYKAAAEFGNAIPTLPSKNSLRKIEGENSIAVDRSQYRIVQTPQCFQIAQITQAYEQEDNGFTDDASVVESAGHKIKMVEGNQENIKITTPPDLLYAEFLLKNNSKV